MTHDHEEALAVGDRLGVMSDGALLQVGAPEELYERPASAFVAGFLGDASLLTVTGGSCAFGAVPDCPVTGNDSGLAVIRPHHVTVELDPAGPCSITAVEFRGGAWRCEVERSGETLICVVADTRPSPGDRCRVSVAPHHEVHRVPSP